MLRRRSLGFIGTSHHLCWAAEEGVRQGWEMLDDGLGGYENDSTTGITD